MLYSCTRTATVGIKVFWLWFVITAAVQSAGVRKTSSSDHGSVPVNSDTYLMKSEENIPANEKFFYWFVVTLMHRLATQHI